MQKINRLNTAGFQIIRQADEWVGSLDRSLLGNFAVDRARLSYYAALSVAREQNPDYPMNNDVSEHVEKLIGFRQDIEAEAEFKFWDNMRYKTVYSGIAWQRDRIDYVNPAEEGEYTARYWRIYHNPEFIHYFEAGVWDVELIKKCVEDGVDPELAMSLSQV